MPDDARVVFPNLDFTDYYEIMRVESGYYSEDNEGSKSGYFFVEKDEEDAPDDAVCLLDEQSAARW